MRRVIGVTGGVGSGKSRVLRILREDFGARVILADQVAHRLMEPGGESYKRIVKALGRGFLGEDGTIDRAKLADLIFHDREALNTVNSITHPLVWRAVRDEIGRAGELLIAVEAALIDEKGHDIYNEMWYVYTSEEVRIRRLMDKRGYSREKCKSIIASQPGEDVYRRISDRVIDNNGGLEETRRQIAEILESEGLAE